MITLIKWSNGSINKFHKGDPNIKDFVQWKKQKNPELRIVLRYNAKPENV
jgi:hypothetical protein